MGPFPPVIAVMNAVQFVTKVVALADVHILLSETVVADSEYPGM